MDAIITPHIWHDLPKGNLGLRSGPVMASSDLFTLKVKGVAGHGAWPHMSVDPLPVAAELILALQKLVSREIDPMIPACISIGKMDYGTAANVVSETVTMQGTVRTFDHHVRSFIEKRIEEIADGVTKAARGGYSLEYHRVMPPLVNDPTLVSFATEVLISAFGSEEVTANYAATMGCEEFSVYLDYVPGIFMLIGSQDSDAPLIEIHNPKFLFPEECLTIGVRALCEIALNYTKTQY